MVHHSQLINLIAEKIKAENYLEIGVFNPDHNFNLINVAKKESVDPDPEAKATHIIESDWFFEQNYIRSDMPLWDLIFIDGLHHADQVKKDIINAWKCLNDGGVIVIHDCNPHSEHITHVPRDNREWCGDVYKTVCNIANPFFTVDFDYGCAVLRKDNSKVWSKDIDFVNNDITWDLFEKNRHVINLVTVEEGINIINSWQPIKQLV